MAGMKRKMEPGMGADQVARTRQEMGADRQAEEEPGYAPGAGNLPRAQSATQPGQRIEPGMGADQVAQTRQQVGANGQARPDARGNAPAWGSVSEPANAVVPGPGSTQRPAGEGWPDKPAGQPLRIGAEDIRKAQEILLKYKQGKKALENRIKSNERWYKLRHWEEIGNTDASGNKQNPSDPEPASAWLLNCLLNKHADAMDNFPTANVLPREPGDEPYAKTLSGVLPAVLEQNEFEDCYSSAWWKKLKNGTGVYGVFWDSSKQNGLGDIDVRPIDLLNIYWQPGLNDIQKSRNFFHVELYDAEAVEELFPEAKGKISGGVTMLNPEEYSHDENIDIADKVAVVDWYYHRKNSEGKTVLHFCKFCGDTVLYASENNPDYQDRGYYDHGKYPFVFDVLFPEVDMPTGFGYLDIGKSPQKYIDKLDQVILKNAILGARPRYFKKKSGSVNVEQFRDIEKYDLVDYEGSDNPQDALLPIAHSPLDALYVQVRNLKIDELKETTSNRDFQQGGTTSGITAAAAISALQEAGSKTSRDQIKSSYRAYTNVCYLCIDLMRQFYQEDRYFRIVGNDGQTQYTAFNGQQIAEIPQGSEYGTDDGVRLPIFDIKVSAQKSSPFSTYAQNEMAKELYGMGLFTPALADQASAVLEMMQFDGIDKVRQRVEQNGLMLPKLMQLGQLATVMAAEIDQNKGTNYAQQVAAITGQAAQDAGSTPPQGDTGRGMSVNNLGEVYNKSKQQTAETARNDASAAATPKA